MKAHRPIGDGVSWLCHFNAHTTCNQRHHNWVGQTVDHSHPPYRTCECVCVCVCHRDDLHTDRDGEGPAGVLDASASGRPAPPSGDVSPGSQAEASSLST